MRVLHITPVYAPAWNYGGPPRSVSALCEGLSSQGVDIDVLTTDANKNERLTINSYPAVRNGVTVFYEEADFLWPFVYSRGFTKKYRQIIPDYDLVHITGVWQPLVNRAYSVCRNTQTPYVISPRGALSEWSFQFHSWRKKLYWSLFEKSNVLNADAIHYTSENEYADTRETIKEIPYFVIPNSIDFDKFEVDAQLGHKFRQKLGFTESDVVIASIGRVHPKKGNEFLIEALTSLPAKYKLLLVGEPRDDGYLNELKNLAKKNNVRDRVVFHPHVSGEELDAAYNSADIFALATHQENFGMSVIEAIYFKLPVIITPEVNIADEIIAQSLGRVVEQNSGSFADEIQDVNENYPKEDLPRRQKYVMNRYSKKSLAGEFKERYEEVIRNGSQ